MDKQHIRTGDKTVARFRFVRSPEYVQPGARLIFREGRTKAVGTVLKLIS
jgi:GTPase